MCSDQESKDSSSPAEDGSQPDSSFSPEEEKTIPFLRRLTDMLLENEDVISFNPGYRKDGEVVLGTIVVHDRVTVEESILPKYFNHSSFASLRRQLNYFSFTRIGKGRQRGATYCNEGVVELQDILTLRRRSNTSNSSSTGNEPTKAKTGSKGNITTGSKSHGGRRLPTKKHQRDSSNSKNHPSKRLRITTNSSGGNQTPSTSGSSMLPSRRVSPVDHVEGPSASRISLDLTGSSSPEFTNSQDSVKVMPVSSSGFLLNGSADNDTGMVTTAAPGDDDILAGCKALLCFSRGIPSR